MTYSMHIEAINTPAMIERILQTTRVRGFHLRHLDVRTQEQNKTLKITLTVESPREQDRLITQLGKLTGIVEMNALHSIDDTAGMAQRHSAV